MDSTRSPLDGVLVLELGTRISVAACGGLLAQLGADVVLVEPPGRDTGPKWLDRAATVAGKHSVVIDHGSRGDRDYFESLVAAADVVLLSSDLAAVDRSLWESPRQPRQIRCDLTAYGHDGPLAGVAGSEACVEALTGVAETTGRRDGPPAVLGAPLVEMETAVYAAASVLAALRVRRLHGLGQRIDIASYDVGVNALAAFLPLPFSGRVATRNGNRHPTLAPWNSYQARDGWIVVCAPTNDQWARLCATMNRPELVSDPRFATTSGRMEQAAALDEIVGSWIGKLTVSDCVAALGEAVIPCGPVVPVEDLASEPNVRHREMVRATADPATGRRVLVPGNPVRWRGAEPTPVIPERDAGRVAIRRLLTTRALERPRVSGDPVISARPLDGVRVVEIGMNTVGPLAGKQLGALGADVIKVEPPRGDSNRHNAPLRDDGQAYVFALLNTDKRGVVLDLRDDTDRAMLWDVLSTSDVLIENLKPGSLGRLGLGPEDVRSALPHLIYCSMNGFGHDTVYPGRPALDTVVQAMSGVMSATEVDGVPTKAGISVSDQLGGLFGLLGVLAALEYRESGGGTGLTLDLAMQDGSAWATHRVWNTGREDRPRIVADDGGHMLEENGSRAHVATVAEVLTHDQTAARELIVERPAPDGGSWPVLGSPMRLCSTPAVVSVAMPRLGYPDPDLATEFGGPARRRMSAGTEV